MCNVIDLIVCTVQSIQIKNTVHVFHVDTVDKILYGIYAIMVQMSTLSIQLHMCHGTALLTLCTHSVTKALRP